MQKELVSVIIPAYNHENYIQETINSIINQTYQNIELIIIDDGSKDSTWQKIKEMEEICKKRFQNIYFETKQNEGTCKTLNRLLDLTNGKFIYLIASDDIAKPNAIEKEINFLTKNSDYLLVVGDNEIIDCKSNVCFWDKDRKITYDKKRATFLTFAQYLQKSIKINFNSEDFGSYKRLYLGNHVPNGYLIRKSIFEKIGYFTTQAPLEDYWLMLQISKYGKMKFINEVLFSYRWHDTNTIKASDKIADYTKKTKEYENEILKNIDLNLTLPEVKNIALNGIIKRKTGIPFIFQIITRIKCNIKTREIKIFNLKIALWKTRG